MKILTDIEAFAEYVNCDSPSEECYLGYCHSCPNEERIGSLLGLINEDEICFLQWTSTDGSRIETLTCSKDDFRLRFHQAIPAVLEHHFLYKQQSVFVKSLKKDWLKDGISCVLNEGFGQNYSFFVQYFVQGFHWNNDQATIHPFVMDT
jgi:hypothetical protein